MPRTFFRGPGQRVPQEESPSIRYYQPTFYDPFFFIQGSVPEKMVLAELVRRGIYFEHTPQKNPIKWGILKEVAPSDPKNWEADFLFPQWKIWLEVQGAYFHTLPGIMEKEAFRFTLIEAAGWRPIFWWDYDIETRLMDIMNEVPEFYRPPGSFTDPKERADRSTGQTDGDDVGQHDVWHGPDRGDQSYYGSHFNKPRTFNRNKRKLKGLPFYEGGEGIDHLAGLRKANSNRATTPQFESRYRYGYGRKSKIPKKYRHAY